MSVHYDTDRRRFVVRWREDGRQRSRRFVREDEALAFDASLRAVVPEPKPSTTARGDGAYAYPTKAGVRYRFVFRQSDGTLSSRRGFISRAAAVTARRRLLASIERHEVVVSRETFGAFWERFVQERRSYLTAGSLVDLTTHGRKRLLPFFADDRLSDIDADRAREWRAGMVALVEAGEISAKTANNARTCLSVALNEAARRGLIPRNPCDGVRALPVVRSEIDYLRLAEIEPYLDACSEVYRPLAEFLIGTGARISEAVAVRWTDLGLDAGSVRIHRQRDAAATRITKGKRFRSVQIGPRLVAMLRPLRASREGAADGGWVFLCPQPERGRYASRRGPVPPHRKTVHDWHEAALQDAGIRDMPLHSLRHTAAAAWLTAGQPLIFVQRQLGHRSITTTEEHYGHLESSFLRDAAAQTEQAIAAAAK